MHYGAPAPYYSKGGYEVTECFLASQGSRSMKKKANEIIRKLKYCKLSLNKR